jgi:hypothetical protein
VRDTFASAGGELTTNIPVTGGEIWRGTQRY